MTKNELKSFMKENPHEFTEIAIVISLALIALGSFVCQLIFG